MPAQVGLHVDSWLLFGPVPAAGGLAGGSETLGEGRLGAGGAGGAGGQATGGASRLLADPERGS